jgi:hypothetical protein
MAIHGVDPEKIEETESPAKSKSNLLLFGDPKDYEKMPIEERNALTEKMMGKWKQWASKGAK